MRLPPGDADRNWKERAASLRVDASAAGSRRKQHEDLEMVAFLCPSCGVLLSVEVKRKNEGYVVEAEPRV